jgi:hypothetical protein
VGTRCDLAPLRQEPVLSQAIAELSFFIGAWFGDGWADDSNGFHSQSSNFHNALGVESDYRIHRSAINAPGSEIPFRDSFYLIFQFQVFFSEGDASRSLHHHSSAQSFLVSVYYNATPGIYEKITYLSSSRIRRYIN